MSSTNSTLIMNGDGHIELMPQLIAEIAGEHFLEPLIDQICNLSFSLVSSCSLFSLAHLFRPLIDRACDLSFSTLWSKPRLNTYAVKVRSKQVNVVFASGPGIWTDLFNWTNLFKAKAKIAEGQTVKSSIFIGDGEANISLDAIIDAVTKAKDELRPITLFINAHGRVSYSKEHMSYANAEHEIYCSELNVKKY